ncbi:MAG: LysR family transcriptional regulator [Nitrospirae bacterium]|nr:LysR family transcriptional regulator [Nitrospirota bacterium]
MDLHHLRIFTEVYKQKSFSKAAEILLLSQPTVSEHIKTLEDELSCKLFDRLGRTIVSTRIADILYPRALNILEEVEKLRTEIVSIQGNIAGHIRIGASTIPGTYILPTLATEFQSRYRDISFEILIEDSKKITDMVLNHELIMGIVGAVMEPERLNYTPFVEDELVLASTGDIINKNTITVEELLRIPFVIREEGSGTRKTIEEHLLKKNTSINNLNIVAILGSTDSVKQAIKSSLGASILSRISIREELERGVLKETKIKGLEIKRDFSIITHKKRTLPPHYQALFEFITERSGVLSE